MELNELCTKLKFEHLPTQLDALCEQAAKRELNLRDFLGRHWPPSGGADGSKAWNGACAWRAFLT
jgi:hypothetical protein